MDKAEKQVENDKEKLEDQVANEAFGSLVERLRAQEKADDVIPISKAEVVQPDHQAIAQTQSQQEFDQQVFEFAAEKLNQDPFSLELLPKKQEVPKTTTQKEVAKPADKAA